MFIRAHETFDSYIGNGVDIKSASFNESNRKKSGIVDCLRHIFIFYDELLTPKKCKVIQINLSVSKCSKSLAFEHVLNPYNGTIAYAATYVYDLTLNVREMGILNQFLHGYLKLISARRIDRDTDWDNKVTKHEGANIGTKDVPGMHSECTGLGDVKVIVAPQYYTLDHMYNATGDVDLSSSSLVNLYGIPISGMDIVDETTKVMVMKPNDFTSMVRDMGVWNDGVQMGSMSENFDGGNPSDLIYEVDNTTGLNSLVSNTDIIWDGTTGRLGVIVPKKGDAGFIFSDYVTKDHKRDELDELISVVQATCQRIEHEYGTIKAFFHPSILGTKCKINFLDYRANNYNPTVSIDAGNEIKEVVERPLFENPANDYLFESLDDGIDQYRSWKCYNYF